jgi:hypothetical protein
MKIHVKEIVDQMSPEVRSQVQKAADKKGVTVEKFVEQQLAVQIRDQEMIVDLDAANTDVRVRADHDPGRGDTRVGGGVGVRF